MRASSRAARDAVPDLSGAHKRDIVELVAAHKVRFPRLQFTDILGVNKNVEIPASRIAKALDGDSCSARARTAAPPP